MIIFGEQSIELYSRIFYSNVFCQKIAHQTHDCIVMLWDFSLKRIGQYVSWLKVKHLANDTLSAHGYDQNCKGCTQVVEILKILRHRRGRHQQGAWHVVKTSYSLLWLPYSLTTLIIVIVPLWPHLTAAGCSVDLSMGSYILYQWAEIGPRTPWGWACYPEGLVQIHTDSPSELLECPLSHIYKWYIHF